MPTRKNSSRLNSTGAVITTSAREPLHLHGLRILTVTFIAASLHHPRVVAMTDVEGCEPEAAPQASVQPGAPAPPATDTEKLYIQHCASCHGVRGNGDGPAGLQLFPKPRSFRESPFRFAATGETPAQIKQSIERAIAQGVPRSAMPGFGGTLTIDQVRSLADYVLALAHADKPPEPAPAPAEFSPSVMPAFTPALVARGAELFRTQACINCHGAEGHGDGAGMAGLVDSLGRPIRPADLTSGVYKSGPMPEDLFRAIARGIPGTPMIPYGSMLIKVNKDHTRDDRDVWALVAFIKSIGPAHNTGISAGAELKAVRAADPTMATNPSHLAWLDAARAVVSVKPLWQRIEYSEPLSVSVAGTGDTITFQLSWGDATCDVSNDLNKFPDGVAVMFALTDEVPSLPMAISVEGQRSGPPVYMWSWKASRQYDASLGRSHDAGEPRTLVEGNFHEFGPAPTKVAPQPEPKPGLDNDLNVNAKYNLSAPAVGNPHTDPALSKNATLEANAEGFGTLTYQPAGQQEATSTAIWANGRWVVNIVHPLKSGQPLDVDLSASRRFSVAFAIWDGSRGDRDGIKHISGWHWLTVNP